jgi:bacterioferritin
MKGNDQIIATLNELLADELTAINQYMVHSEMCDNWGYERLHKSIEKRAVDEMKHAEKLIARIIFLEGLPVVSKLNPMHIGKDVKSMMDSDLGAENGADSAYNAAIMKSVEVKDSGTRELLEHILEDEERHIDWIEAQIDQIAQMGVQNYLAMQTKEE